MVTSQLAPENHGGNYAIYARPTPCVSCTGDSMIEAEVELAGLDDNEINLTLQCDFEIYCTGREGCKDGELRLVGGKIEQEGFVEVCMSGAWGSLCLSSPDYKTGRVVCSRLGHKGKGEQCYIMYFQGYTLF